MAHGTVVGAGGNALVLVHERELRQDLTPVAVVVRLALHRLRHPVRVGELLERVEVRVLEQGNRVDFDRLGAAIGEADLLHQDRFAGRDEDADLALDAVELSTEMAVAETDTALVTVIGIECGHEQRRENLRALARALAQVERVALELGARQLRDVLGDPVQRGISLAQQKTARVVDEATEAERANVVDPFDRRARVGNHVLAGLVVEVAVLHCSRGSLQRS